MKHPLFLRHTDKSTVDLLVTFHSSRVFNSATQENLPERGWLEGSRKHKSWQTTKENQPRSVFEGMKESRKSKVFFFSVENFQEILLILSKPKHNSS